MTDEPPGRRADPAAETAGPGAGASNAAGADAAGEPVPDRPLDPEEARRLARRRFFRSMAADAMRTAATIVGAAGAFRTGTQEVAAALINAASAGAGEPPGPETPAVESAVPLASTSGQPWIAAGGVAPAPPVAAGFRSPFRLDGDRLIVLDQRRLPDAFVEVECRSGADVSQCIREGIVRGAPLLGQVAAAGLALTAAGAVAERPFARRAILHGTANALVNAAPTAAPVRTATDRLLARLQAVGDVAAEGQVVAEALRAEADAVIEEATLAHAALCRHGVTALPEVQGRPLRILTLDDTGPLAGGLVGTALGVATLAAADGRAVHVWLMESRPGFEGSRLAAWTLAQSGVPHTVIADVAAGTLFGHDEVDVVLVGADRITASGDVAARTGTYTLAILAGSHEIPLLVVAPLAAYDPSTADLTSMARETRPAAEVIFARETRVAPIGTGALNPAADAVPADLITAIVTEAGAIRAPYREALAAAAAAAAARRPTPVVASQPTPAPGAS